MRSTRRTPASAADPAVVTAGRHRPARRTAVLVGAVGALTLGLLPLGATSAVAAPTAVVSVAAPATAPALALAPTAARSSALQHAMGKLGAPYRWGAEGPSAFDCSGLVQWAFGAAGVDLPRTSRAMSTVGTRVAKADLQPGDLVFFYSPVRHVGIYVGEGKMVHASTSGQPVKVSSIDGRPFHSARRI